LKISDEGRPNKNGEQRHANNLFHNVRFIEVRTIRDG
jgi:hypothetical protein